MAFINNPSKTNLKLLYRKNNSLNIISTLIRRWKALTVLMKCGWQTKNGLLSPWSYSALQELNQESIKFPKIR